MSIKPTNAIALGKAPLSDIFNLPVIMGGNFRTEYFTLVRIFIKMTDSHKYTMIMPTAILHICISMRKRKKLLNLSALPVYYKL